MPAEPSFWDRKDRISSPGDFKPNTVTGKVTISEAGTGKVLREPNETWAKPSLENLEYYAQNVFR
jgi:hypothetical protein